jgi:ATP-dependent Lhr-like helicase
LDGTHGTDHRGELAQVLAVPDSDVRAALLALEAEGVVLRGVFRPTRARGMGLETGKGIEEASRTPPTAGEAPAPEEWCHRRLLARIHRLTIGRLRREIEPVTTAEFMRFLFRWQHVAPGSQQHGEPGLLGVIQQLAGFEAAASAWEGALLPLRLSKYEPGLLDRLCLSGAVMWGRLTPHPRLGDAQQAASERGASCAPSRIVPTSVAPISLFPREDAEWLLRAFGAGLGAGTVLAISSIAQDLLRYLDQWGASFFTDLVRGTGHLRAQIEDSLWALVAAGLVTADGFENLRALLDPRRRRAGGCAHHGRACHGTGRWSLLRPLVPVSRQAGTPAGEEQPVE